jgi:hypothetical protein
VKTGASSDEVKTRLRALQAKIDQHQRAVDDVSRDYGDNTAVRDYAAEWSNYKKKVAGLAEDADAWTSVTFAGAVKAVEIEFGILLLNFTTLSAKLTAAKRTEKIKALETILANTPTARAAYQKDAEVKLKTDATPIAVPPANPPANQNEFPAWAFPVAGLAGLLWILKKIFIG